MKGIILAGGNGSRLYPATLVTSKQLLPIFDKPLIYYPLSVLMLAEIKDVLIICKKKDLPSFKLLLGNGSHLGMKITYKTQGKPNGIPEAFLIGEEFIEDKNVCLILGDNIFYGSNLKVKLINAISRKKIASAFAYHVNKPVDFGVVEFNSNNEAISIEEKPKIPKSNYALTGLYFYPNSVVKFSKTLIPSSRGELEITDINNIYLKRKELYVEDLGRGYAWLDTGTPTNMRNATSFVQTVEERTGLKIGCIEEIALFNNWISQQEIFKLGEKLKNTEYGKYLIKISRE